MEETTLCPPNPQPNRDFYKWKLQKQLGPILSAGLLVICELDRALLDDTLQNSVSEVEACIVKHLPILSSEANDAHHLDITAAPQRGPCFEHQPSGSLISVPDAPAVPPSSSTAATNVPSGQVPASEPGKRGRKPYICEICGKTKQRKPDSDGHKWFYHQVGTPIQCNTPPCKENNFASKGSLKQHMKNVHEKLFRYICRQCPYGYDSRDYYLTHRVTKHNVKIRSHKTHKPIVFRCQKCKKVFSGTNLLKNHERRGLCMTRKIYQCPECLKFYKTQAYLDLHFKQHHTPGANTWVCELCSKVCNSQSAAHNHQLWHRGLGVLQRAQAASKHCRQMEAMKTTSQNIEQKLPHLTRKKARKQVLPKAREPKAKKGGISATKSAPAKIIPRRSPRQLKGKKKN